MKIIISPSKTQNESGLSHGRDKLIDRDKSLQLLSILKNLNKLEIKKIMKTSSKLTDEVYQMYHNFRENNPRYTSISLYSGLVFEQLELSTYNQNQMDYMNNNLLILSAMYGLLSPNTKIWPYRLDMTMKPNNINLYKFWQKAIEQYFNDQEWIINLASNEFSKMIKNHKDKMINIEFYQRKDDGKLRSLSYYAKKVRGQFLNEMIKRQIKDIETIKTITIDGYHYSIEYSKDQNFVYIKN